MDTVCTRRVADIPPSPNREDGARPEQQRAPNDSAISALLGRLTPHHATVLRRLVATFGIPDSAVGLIALLSELTGDIAVVAKLPNILPAWAQDIDALRVAMMEASATDPARDLASLRGSPRTPLRDFLTPRALTLPPSVQRGLRAVRGLVALRLISAGETLSSAQANEVKRWLQGKAPGAIRLEGLRPKPLCEMRAGLAAESPAAKLLSYLIETLDAALPHPFQKNGTESEPVHSARSEGSAEKELDSEAPPGSVSPMDHLHSCLAERGVAGVRVFSGTAALYRGLLPGEVETLVPRIISLWREGQADEGLAALLALLLRILPVCYASIPLGCAKTAGKPPNFWIDVQAGHACWNLDEALRSRAKRRKLSSPDRYFRIPLPLEVAQDLRRRAAMRPAAATLEELFEVARHDLARRTKQALRAIATSSHRPTLTRLAHSWGRYVLSLCADEAYAAAIGLDFTLGTTANYHYVMVRARRLLDIASAAYRRIGLSGDCPDSPLRDIGSLRLPAENVVASLVKSSLGTVQRHLIGLPQRVSMPELEARHNAIAINIYVVLRLLLGERTLVEETVTGSCLDVATGLVAVADKRVAPYHERRILGVPPTLRGWLAAYIAWLRLLAYRLAGTDRQLSRAIVSVTELAPVADVHPLFFRFDRGRTVPLGSADVAATHSALGLQVNAGRHFLDGAFRVGAGRKLTI